MVETETVNLYGGPADGTRVEGVKTEIGAVLMRVGAEAWTYVDTGRRARKGGQRIFKAERKVGVFGVLGIVVRRKEGGQG